MKHEHVTVREMHDLSCIFLLTHIWVIKYCRMIGLCLEVATSLLESSLYSTLHGSSARSFLPVCTAASLLSVMAEERMDLLRQAVRSMLVALQMPEVDDTELHDLTLHIGHTGMS